jgi:uncharacterized protein (DUF1697 family)
MSMPQYFAFLRAINVGGRTVKMDTLRALFEACGFSNVSTFIASGNVIFDTDDTDGRDLEQSIEQRLRRGLGYDVATFLRTVAELDTIAAHRPFVDDRGDHTVYVVFLRERPGAAVRRAIVDLGGLVDDLRVNDREIHWLCRSSLRESALSGSKLESVVGGPVTIRNLNTVDRLVAKFVRTV